MMDVVDAETALLLIPKDEAYQPEALKKRETADIAKLRTGAQHLGQTVIRYPA